MPSASPRKTVITLSWSALFKVLAAVAFVWLWLRLVQLVLVVIVAVLLAVTLNPVVEWLERRGLPRWVAATTVGVTLAAVIGGFCWITWASLNDEAHYAIQHLKQFEKQGLDAVPGWARAAMGNPDNEQVWSYIGPFAVRLGASIVSALFVGVLGFILMIYLIIESDRTRAWLLAFVPATHRPRVEKTLDESERVIFSYVAGNVLTSIFAAVFVGVSMALLGVPGALLLALIAGIFDFVPVVGFIVSSVFAVLMALTVSPATAAIAFALYLAYHLIENYLISPWAYGDFMKLSNVAVILSFAVGAEIAGVIGALIALPIAAVYPAVERIWLREELPEDTVRHHRALEKKAG
jgi:predicted PurR-regulated permease PerM